jgi:hypothetical protein
MSGGRLNVYQALLSDGSTTPAGGGGGSAPSSPAAGTASGHVRGPNTYFRQKPRRVVRTEKPRARVVFKFRSSEAGSTFLCKLDRSAYSACARRYVPRLRPGRHRLRVRAVGPGGTQDPSAAVARFKVKQVSRNPH